MFLGAPSFNNGDKTNGGLNPMGGWYGNWDTSNVTNMSYMFMNAKAFNQTLN